MSVYVVAQSRIENRKVLDEYVGKALPTITAGGGKVLAFDEEPAVIEGENPLPRTVILEFPTHEVFQSWYDSEGYQAVLPLRLQSAPGNLIVVKGLG